MFSRFLRLCVLLALASGSVACASAPLRICADPDNLPFSNRAGQGFDNQIAVMLAQSLGRKPVFVWARSRRGFLREQFNRNACDLLMGVPAGMRSVATTHPYYRSTYVFVTPAREHLQIASFDDQRLDGRRIGLQILEEDMSPPSLPLDPERTRCAAGGIRILRGSRERYRSRGHGWSGGRCRRLGTGSGILRRAIAIARGAHRCFTCHGSKRHSIRVLDCDRRS